MSSFDTHASTPLTATGPVKNLAGVALARVRVQKILFTASATGSIVLRDGDSGGPIVLNMPFTAAGPSLKMKLPGRGLLCANGVYATITGASSVVVFYE